jgi:hypothetical protein
MRNTRSAWLILLLILTGCFILLVVTYFENRQAPSPLFIPATNTINSEISSFFDTMQAAIARRDGSVGSELFDPDRLYREAFVVAEFPRPDPHGPVKVVNAVWGGFTAGWLGTGWSETKLQRIEHLPGGAEVIVTTRHRTSGGVVPARWWLVRHEGKWRVYDLEDVRVGLRLSHQVAISTTLQTGENEYAELATAMTALTQASAALASGDIPIARQALDRVRIARLPSRIRAVHCLTESAVAIGANDPDSALAWADRADRARPGIPGTDLIRAVAFHRKRNWHEATIAATRYIKLLGPDPQVNLVLGQSLLELGRRKEAIEVLREANVEYPGHADLLAALQRATDSH